ncbi:hypothetical protein T08_6251 [Trichinella sp. T8]|nr:hypothetical protein T08_6251 [Trichinella sp. T8]
MLYSDSKVIPKVGDIPPLRGGGKLSSDMTLQSGAFERYIPFKGAIAGKGLGTTGLEAIRTQTLSFIEYWELELSGVRD